MSSITNITPEVIVDTLGQVKWNSVQLDYNAQQFPRGKTVTSEEFNNLFIKQILQSNYTAASFKEFLNNSLNLAVFRQVSNRFSVFKGYTKLYLASDWGTSQNEDGYYYIDIPAEEHGFEKDSEAPSIPNVEVIMYALDDSGALCEVDQFEIDTDNSVKLYTDNISQCGVVFIRPSKIVSVSSDVTLDASQISGLAGVAVSGDYRDLLNKPDNTITQILDDIDDIKDGSLIVKKAEEASAIPNNGKLGGRFIHAIFEDGSNIVTDAKNAMNLYAKGTIGDIEVSKIFEEKSNIVKEARVAYQLAENGTIGKRAVTNIFEVNSNFVKNATQATRATYASADTSKGTIEDRLTKLGFKEGGLTDTIKDTFRGYAVNVTQASVKRYGNVVIGSIEFTIMNNTNSSKDIGVNLLTPLYSWMKPQTNIQLQAIISGTNHSLIDSSTTGYLGITYDSDGYVYGSIHIQKIPAFATVKFSLINFGYEAAPL